MPVSRPALLLPCGLRSWLYAVTRAVVCQKPKDVTEFIAAYCQELYEFSREHPELNMHDLTHLFREMKGSPQDHQPLTQDDWKDLSAESMPSISSFTREEISQSFEISSQIQDVDHSVNQVKQSPVVSEDLIAKEMGSSTTSMRSAVFRRSTVSCHAELIKNSFIIYATPPPSDQVVVIHSKTLPDTIVFHTKGAVSSKPSAGSGSSSVPPTPGQDHGGESFDAGAFADVVIYNKVPSTEDLPYPLSISEDLSSTAVALDFPQTMHSANVYQTEAAQKEISETHLSAKVKIRKEISDVTKASSETKSAPVSPEISFTTVRTYVSDTAVVKLLRPYGLGLSDDFDVNSYITITERTTETSGKEVEPRVPQNSPIPAGEEFDSLAVSDVTTASTLKTARSSEQLTDAKIEELPEQSLAEHERQDLGKSASDDTVMEAARSALSNLIDQLLAQDFLETCGGETEYVEGVQSDLKEDLLHIHDTEKKASSVCSTATEPSLEALLLHLCERSNEETVFTAEMQMDHRAPATRLEHYEARETSPESEEKEQTLRMSPELFLPDGAVPVTAEAELKMDPPTDEQLNDAELYLSCELEPPLYDVPELLEENKTALECALEPVLSTCEPCTYSEIQQHIDPGPEPDEVKPDAGAISLSISETYEEEILGTWAETETSFSPETLRHTVFFSDDGSTHEQTQSSTEKASLSYSADQLPETSSVVTLETLETEVAEIDDSEVSETVDSELAKTVDSEVVETIDREVPETADNEVAETIEDKVRETVNSEVSEKVFSDVPEAFDSEVAETIESEVSETVGSEVAENVDSEVPETVDSEVPETVDNEVAETVNSKVAVTIDSDVAVTIYSEVAETVNSEVAETVDSEVAETVNSEVPETVDSELPETVDNEVAETVDSDVAVTIDSEVPESVDSEVAVTVDSEVPKTLDSDVPETYNSEVPETVDSEFTETVDSEVLETVDSEIPETVNSEVAETVDSEVAETVHSEVAETVHSEFSETVGSEITETVDSDVAVTFDSEFPESVDSEVAVTVDSEVPETLDSDVPESYDSEVPETVDNEVAEHVDSDVAVTVDSEFPETVDSELPETVDSEVPETVDSEITETVDSEITETVDSEVPETVDSEITETVDSELPETLDSEMTETVDSEVPETVNDEVAETVDSEITETVDSEVPETVNSEVAGTVDSELPETVDSEVPETVDSEVPETVDSELPETVDSEVPETVDSELPETVDSEVPETVDSELPETVDSEVPETVDSELPETVDSEVPETVDSELLETVDSEITETVDSEVPETVESEITETVDSEVPETVNGEVAETVDSEVPETIDNEVPETVHSEVIETINSEVPCSNVEMEMKHRVTHLEDTSEVPSEGAETDQTLRVCPEPLEIDEIAISTTGSEFDPVQSRIEQLIDADVHQHDELEIPELSLQKPDSGGILLSVSETGEKEASPSSAGKETAYSLEAAKHTVIVSDEESAHEPLQTEEKGQFSSENVFPSCSADHLSEKPSLFAIEALETHDSELPSLRRVPKETSSEAEMERKMDRQDNSWEAPLESVKKENSLIVSLEAFLTDDHGLATTGYVFQMNDNRVHENSELDDRRHEDPEAGLKEHDLAAVLPSRVLETGEEQTSTSSSEEATSSETGSDVLIGSDEESDFELLHTEEGQSSTQNFSSHLHNEKVSQQQHIRDASTWTSDVSTTHDSLSLKVQTSSHSSDSASKLDFEREGPSHDPGVDLSGCQREQAFTSPHFTMAADTEPINSQIYVLMTEEEKSSDLENNSCEKDKTPQAPSQKRAAFPAFLSLTLPMDSQATPADSARNMEWTLKISLRTEHSTSEPEKGNFPDHK